MRHGVDTQTHSRTNDNTEWNTRIDVYDLHGLHAPGFLVPVTGNSVVLCDGTGTSASAQFNIVTLQLQLEIDKVHAEEKEHKHMNTLVVQRRLRVIGNVNLRLRLDAQLFIG